MSLPTMTLAQAATLVDGWLRVRRVPVSGRRTEAERMLVDHARATLAQAGTVGVVLPMQSRVGAFGAVWEGDNWMVTCTAEGTDVWTHPTEPLQPGETAGLAAALSAAAAYRVEA